MRTVTLAVLACLALAGTLWLGTRSAPSPPAPMVAASGDLEYRQGTYRVRLIEQPCPFYDVAEQLEAEGVPPAKRAAVTTGSRTHTACWIPDGTGEIMTLDQDGKGGTLPQEWFRR